MMRKGEERGGDEGERDDDKRKGEGMCVVKKGKEIKKKQEKRRRRRRERERERKSVCERERG